MEAVVVTPTEEIVWQPDNGSYPTCAGHGRCNRETTL